jgi:hypothetical protein
MKEKQKEFLGFAVIAIAAIVTMAGCNLPEENVFPEKNVFPKKFRGTWISERWENNLVISTTEVTDNSINYSWKLIEISGDDYKLKVKGGSQEVTIHLVLKDNGILNVSGNGDYSFWPGDWRKQK